MSIELRALFRFPVRCGRGLLLCWIGELRALLSGALALTNRVEDHRVSGALTAFAGGHTASVGYDAGWQRFRFNANYPLLLYPSDTVNNRNTTVGAYVEDLWRVNDRWIVQAGARVDAVVLLDIPPGPLDSEREVTRVLQALDRLDDGSYGRCTICRYTIRFERLLVFPEARTCAACGDSR